MKNNFKLMTYAEMAEFIFNMEENKVYSFTTAWVQDGNGLDECLDTFWYGIVKHRLFDTTVITMGYFGGGSVSSFDYEYDDSPKDDYALPCDRRDCWPDIVHNLDKKHKNHV